VALVNVLFVHGYSETSLGAYYDFPKRLQTALPSVNEVMLAAFNSLDDTVTIDDLADAMESRVVSLGPAWTQGPWAIICHSTGALVARRWLLNRLETGAIPTHLITMGGANHGSTLAQMGKSVLGYVQKLFAKQSPTVGANVLTDLDYGSDFLLRLNAEWMARWNDGSLDRLWTFSMGGDSIGTDETLQIFWQTHEPGSDNTVRISGANLNYTLIDVTHAPSGPVVKATRPVRPVPHLVLPGYSHFGPTTGILGWTNPTGDLALGAVLQALGVNDAPTYVDVAAEWTARTQAWASQSEAAHAAPGGPPSAVNSTVLLTIRDESGRSIEDCVITFLDQQALGSADNAVDPQAAAQVVAASNSVSSSIMPHSPIQNNVQRASYSFYIDYNEYLNSSPHWFHIQAALAGQLVNFLPLTFTQPPELDHAITPNEFTYISLTMKRDTSQTYAVYEFGPTLDLSATLWMPFPAPGRIC
jgi:hypothetical protein